MSREPRTDQVLTSQIPPTLTFDGAATFPIAVATAAFGLYSPKEAGGIALTPPWEASGRGKYAGQPILVVAGASSVGQLGTSHLPGPASRR